MDFNELAKIRPELNQIKRDAKNWYDNPDRWRFYEQLKGRMKKLVGWNAEKGYPDFMYTSDAYGVAHKEIFR